MITTIRIREGFEIYEKITGDISGDISGDINQKNGDIIIIYMREKGKITNKEARELLGLGSTRIGEIFTELCDKDIIVSHGKNKGRYYTLK